MAHLEGAPGRVEAASVRECAASARSKAGPCAFSTKPLALGTDAWSPIKCRPALVGDRRSWDNGKPRPSALPGGACLSGPERDIAPALFSSPTQRGCMQMRGGPAFGHGPLPRPFLGAAEQRGPFLTRRGTFLSNAECCRVKTTLAPTRRGPFPQTSSLVGLGSAAYLTAASPQRVSQLLTSDMLAGG